MAQPRGSQIAASLLCLVFVGAVCAKTIPGYERVNINYEVDTVLSFVRSDSVLKNDLGNIRLPMSLKQAGVNLENLKLNNLTNLYRDADASLSIVRNSVVANVTVQVRHLVMNGNWWKKEGANFSGTIGFDFESLTIRTVLTIQARNVTLTEFTVTSIGYIHCTDFTGVSILSSIVRRIAQILLNTNMTKNSLATKIEARAYDMFNKIFKGPKRTGGDAGPLGRLWYDIHSNKPQQHT